MKHWHWNKALAESCVSGVLSFKGAIEDKASKAPALLFKAVLEEVCICRSQGPWMLCIHHDLCGHIRARALDTGKDLSLLSIPLDGSSVVPQKLQLLSLLELKGSVQPGSLF